MINASITIFSVILKANLRSQHYYYPIYQIDKLLYYCLWLQVCLLYSANLLLASRFPLLLPIGSTMSNSPKWLQPSAFPDTPSVTGPSQRPPASVVSAPDPKSEPWLLVAPHSSFSGHLCSDNPSSLCLHSSKGRSSFPQWLQLFAHSPFRHQGNQLSTVDSLCWNI